MNALKEAFDRRGLSVLEAAKAGIPYSTLYHQYHGSRVISALTALKYEKILNIPCSELRPDLWPPVEEFHATEA